MLCLVSVSRNPSQKQELFRYAILGFALTEAVGLLGLMMAFSYSVYVKEFWVC